MAIIVKRFRVRRNGKVYGPGQMAGQVITGFSKEEEARLIAESNGSIEKYVPPKIEELPEDDNKKPEGGESGKSENETGTETGAESNRDSEPDAEPAEDPSTESDPESENIAAVDPDDLIKPGGMTGQKNNKKRGR